MPPDLLFVQPQTIGCPIHRSLIAMGGKVQSPISQLISSPTCVSIPHPERSRRGRNPLLAYTTNKLVISTGARDGFIVHCGAEKPASPPRTFTGHDHSLHFHSVAKRRNLLLAYITHKLVISTGARDGFIVHCGAEKPASPPRTLTSHKHSLHFHSVAKRRNPSRLRARLQPCRTRSLIEGALAPEVRLSLSLLIGCPIHRSTPGLQPRLTLPGTPSLQAWPSTAAKKPGALAPGVCLLVTRRGFHHA